MFTLNDVVKAHPQSTNLDSQDQNECSVIHYREQKHVITFCV